MGSRYSSRWLDYKKAGVVEDCKVLDVARLTSENRPIPGASGEVAWNIWGREFVVEYRYWLLSEGLYLVFDYSRYGEAIRLPVRLVATETALGGTRWWGVCTICHDDSQGLQRAGKLYLPDDEYHFACRRCHRLTYESAQLRKTRVQQLIMPGHFRILYRYLFNPRRRRWARHSTYLPKCIR